MRNPSTRRRRKTGHTLLEMAAALAIVSILVLGVTSAMLVASRAVDPDNHPRATHAASEAAARVMRELEFATAFTERADHTVTFTVADRDGDGSEETIRYAWSGAAGEALTRACNAGTAVASVLDDVRECNFTYDLKVVTEEPDAARNESAEVLLASHQTAVEPKDQEIKDTKWIGQYVEPSLPPGAVSWRVTRVLVKARIHGADKGVAGVQLRLPTAANLPSRTILEEVPMYENRLTEGYLWQEFTFGNAAGLDPSRGLCLAVACILNDADLCDIQYDKSGPGGMCRATGGEGTWAEVSGQSMLFVIYGTVTTTSEPEAVTQTWVQGVGLRLRAGPDPHTAVETGVRVLNAPEITE